MSDEDVMLMRNVIPVPESNRWPRWVWFLLALVMLPAWGAAIVFQVWKFITQWGS